MTSISQVLSGGQNVCFRRSRAFYCKYGSPSFLGRACEQSTAGIVMSSLGLQLDARMPAEPLTNNPNRSSWIEDEALRVARSHQSYMANPLSSNTVHKMQQKESIALADADGGGTIDKEEFATLLAAAGGQDNAEDMGALFAAADIDGDGELTEEEIKALSDFKRKSKE